MTANPVKNNTNWLTSPSVKHLLQGNVSGWLDSPTIFCSMCPCVSAQCAGKRFSPFFFPCWWYISLRFLSPKEVTDCIFETPEPPKFKCQLLFWSNQHIPISISWSDLMMFFPFPCPLMEQLPVQPWQLAAQSFWSWQNRPRSLGFTLASSSRRLDFQLGWWTFWVVLVARQLMVQWEQVCRLLFSTFQRYFPTGNLDHTGNPIFFSKKWKVW